MLSGAQFDAMLASGSPLRQALADTAFEAALQSQALAQRLAER